MLTGLGFSCGYAGGGGERYSFAVPDGGFDPPKASLLRPKVVGATRFHQQDVDGRAVVTVSASSAIGTGLPFIHRKTGRFVALGKIWPTLPHQGSTSICLVIAT